jgi:anti-sigma B factor antagonist
MAAESSDIAHVRKEGAAHVVTVHGDVDMHRSPALHQVLLDVMETRPHTLVVDLADVSYMDSSGVGTLVDCFRRVKESKAKMTLVGLQPRVRGVFEITKLDQFFTIRDTVAEALP